MGDMSFVSASSLEVAPSPPSTGNPDSDSPRAKRMREAVVRQREHRASAPNSGADAVASNSGLINVKDEGRSVGVSQRRRDLLLPASAMALPVETGNSTPFGNDFWMDDAQGPSEVEEHIQQAVLQSIKRSRRSYKDKVR